MFKNTEIPNNILWTLTVCFKPSTGALPYRTRNSLISFYIKQNNEDKR